MKDVYGRLLVLCGLVVFSVTALHAARLTLFIDGDNRTPYDASRGKVGRAEWTAAVTRRKGTHPHRRPSTASTSTFPRGRKRSVGHFSIFFTQTGGISTQAGNTAKLKHPTGVFVGTTGTGSTNGKNDEQIRRHRAPLRDGAQKTTALELRFNPPIFAWAADVYSVDGKGFGQQPPRERRPHDAAHPGARVRSCRRSSPTPAAATTASSASCPISRSTRSASRPAATATGGDWTTCPSPDDVDFACALSTARLPARRRCGGSASVAGSIDAGGSNRERGARTWAGHGEAARGQSDLRRAALQPRLRLRAPAPAGRALRGRRHPDQRRAQLRRQRRHRGRRPARELHVAGAGRRGAVRGDPALSGKGRALVRAARQQFRPRQQDPSGHSGQPLPGASALHALPRVDREADRPAPGGHRALRGGRRALRDRAERPRSTSCSTRAGAAARWGGRSKTRCSRSCIAIAWATAASCTSPLATAPGSSTRPALPAPTRPRCAGPGISRFTRSSFGAESSGPPGAANRASSPWCKSRCIRRPGQSFDARRRKVWSMTNRATLRPTAAPSSSADR